MVQDSTAVIGLEARRARAAPRQNPAQLMERVYSAGSLVLRADDRPAKGVAAMLAALGLVVVDELRPDGSVERLGPGRFRGASPASPWRVLKADLGAGREGLPDAVGLA